MADKCSNCDGLGVVLTGYGMWRCCACQRYTQEEARERVRLCCEAHDGLVVACELVVGSPRVCHTDLVTKCRTELDKIKPTEANAVSSDDPGMEFSCALDRVESNLRDAQHFLRKTSENTKRLVTLTAALANTQSLKEST